MSLSFSYVIEFLKLRAQYLYFAFIYFLENLIHLALNINWLLL